MLDVSGKRVNLYGRGRKGYYTPSGARDRLRYADALYDGNPYDGDLYADALYAGRKLSVARMSAECAALGGDGGVGVRAGLSPCPWDRREVAFTAYGVAVRVRGSVRAPTPFAAHLSGPDFAKLILNGWGAGRHCDRCRRDVAELGGGDDLVLAAAETRAHLGKAVGGTRCIAEATFIGTVIAAFGMRGKDHLAGLQILRLHDRRQESDRPGQPAAQRRSR